MSSYRLILGTDSIPDSRLIINDNFEALRANFDGVTEPSNPIKGQIAYINGQLSLYDGSSWKKVWTEDTDGSGSGLDADKLDGYDSSYFLAASSYTASDVLTKIKTVDGPGSGLDADLLDGLNSTVFTRSGRTVTITGDVSGSTTVASDGNINISVSVIDDSHNHIISNIDNLQTTLDGKLSRVQSSSPSADNAYNLGDATHRWSNIYAITFQGNATSANYADLAEKYTIKEENVEVGDVVVISEEDIVDCEISKNVTPRVLGVVSENPAFKMNSQLEKGKFIALVGRVPCKVYGRVKKGDPLVCYEKGCAISIYNPLINDIDITHCIFAKSNQNKYTNDIEKIEIILK